MKEIKQVIRERLPETNSSSSHSVVICVNKNYLTDMLPMDDNGVIHVPKKESFGWEYEKYNDAMTKLQYVCGIIWRFKSNRKSVKKLKNIIMNYTGATDVVFEWEEEKRLLDLDPEKYENDDDDYFYNSGAPEIDHNSSDIFPEIIESSTSIKNFIFNTKSWLYLGNDNSESPEDFFEDETEIEEHNITVSIDYGGKIGRVDFEYNKTLGDDIINILSDEDLVRNIVYDSTKKEFEMESNTFIGWRTKYDNDTKFQMRQFNLGDGRLYWISSSIRDEIIKKISDIQSKNDEGRKSSSMLPFYIGETEESIFRDLLNDPKWSDQYVSIPFTVTINEFGKIL